MQTEKIQFLKTGKKNSKHECDLLQAENLKIHEFKFFRLIKIEKKKRNLMIKKYECNFL